MAAVVSLRAVVDEMEMLANDEMHAYLNRETGELYGGTSEQLAQAEECDNDEELIGWEVEVIHRLREVLASRDLGRSCRDATYTKSTGSWRNFASIAAKASCGRNCYRQSVDVCALDGFSRRSDLPAWRSRGLVRFLPRMSGGGHRSLWLEAKGIAYKP